MTDTVPQRIVRRVIAERRAGAPDDMIAKYAITEALHAITRHDGPAADCTPCHEATARAVDDIRTPRPLDLTGASIVIEPGMRPEDWQTSWVPSMVSTRTWESIYGPLDPAPPPVPESERRTHRCDERCTCPADGLPMFYAPSTGQHACQDPDCRHAHPDGD